MHIKFGNQFSNSGNQCGINDENGLPGMCSEVSQHREEKGAHHSLCDLPAAKRLITISNTLPSRYWGADCLLIKKSGPAMRLIHGSQHESPSFCLVWYKRKWGGAWLRYFLPSLFLCKMYCIKEESRMDLMASSMEDMYCLSSIFIIFRQIERGKCQQNSTWEKEGKDKTMGLVYLFVYSTWASWKLTRPL